MSQPSATSPAKSSPAPIHHVVIVGGGAAGLELATQLGERFEREGGGRVTLVDRSRTHLWKPLLHAVAAGSLDPGDHELDYLAQAYWHHFRYWQGELIGLDREAREIRVGATCDEDGQQVTPETRIGYDTLVVAVGSVTNDFGTPGAAEFAIPLDTTEQAKRFNRRLINACLRAQSQPDSIHPGQLHVAIIGAGATGTELAAELHRTAKELVAFGMDRIDPLTDIRIILIEASPRILPALPEDIARAATGLMRQLGIEVRTASRVAEVRRDGVVLADGEFVPAGLVVWAAGVKAPDGLRELGGLETNRIHQLVVTPTLQATRDPDVFAIGDCAQCPRPGHDTPVPPRAQAAHQQASHLLAQIPARIAGQPLKPYVYRDFGSLVTLGRYSTVGSLMGSLIGNNFRVQGLIARLMYSSLYKLHLLALSGGRRRAFRWFGRGLSRRSRPQVKLH